MLVLSVAVWLLVSTASVFTQDSENCQCISYFLCNGTIVENDSKCTDDFDVCCVVAASTGSVDPFPDTGPGDTDTSTSTTTTQRPVGQADEGPVCGKRGQPVSVGSVIDWKVIDESGGDVSTSFGEFPWMVAVMRYDSSGQLQYLCGGSIIYPQIILTAAHTVRGYAAGDLLVKAGVWDTVNPEEVTKHQDRTVSRVVEHPGFDRQKIENDVAILVLSQPLTITENVAPVCLPSAETKLNTSSCVATGWGTDNYGKNTTSSILKKVDLPLVDYETCQNRLRQVQKLGQSFNLHTSFICAGGEKADTCLGDGGGPLMCAMQDDPLRYVQMGVTSWGVGCAQGPPGAYSSVQSAVSWIESTADNA